MWSCANLGQSELSIIQINNIVAVSGSCLLAVAGIGRSLVMQAQTQNYKGSRCLKLASPRKLYDSLLVGISKEFGEKEKNVFRFSFRRDLPCSVLESHDPLKWFRHLEQQGNLSWNNVISLIEFLKEASRGELVSEVRNYQARIKTIGFFQKHLHENLPELMCIGKISNNRLYTDIEIVYV